MLPYNPKLPSFYYWGIHDHLIKVEDNANGDIAQALEILERCSEHPIKDYYASYDDYLNSPEWKELRESVLNRDGHQCVICGRRDNLRAHHTSYEWGIMENGEHLYTLCDDCHRKVHHIAELEYGNEKGAIDDEIKRMAIPFADAINRAYPNGIDGGRKITAVRVFIETFKNNKYRILSPDFRTTTHLLIKKPKYR